MDILGLQFEAITNKAAVDIHGQIFVWIMTFISSWGENGRSYDKCNTNFKEMAELFSNMAVPFIYLVKDFCI